MAREASFDIVTTTNIQEVDNAFQQTKREMAQRYDLKGSGAQITFEKGAGTLTLMAPSDFVADQVLDVLIGKLIRRKVDPKAIRWGNSQAASGGSVRRVGAVVQGIDLDLARKIRDDIKGQKFARLKVAVEGDKLRCTCPSRDTLQQAIAFLREQDYGQPLSYENYR